MSPRIDRATVALAHATGFCAGVWNPVIEALNERRPTISWDFPNHGGAPRLPPPVDWWVFGQWAHDQVASQPGPVVGVGHSMGGAALTMAEILWPGTFGALVLVEPVLIPPPYSRTESGLSVGVLKRRRAFASRDEARDNFASKAPFLTWEPAALEGYLDCGLVDSGDGGIELACTPEAEADLYEGASAHAAWERLREVQTPVLILAGAESDSHSLDRVEAISRRFPRAGFEIVPGATHFLPMEIPRLLAARIERIASALEIKTGLAEPSPE